MALTMCVPGLTCRHAVRVVSARLLDVPGVESVEVDGPVGWVVVRGPVDAQQIRAALVEAGYRPNLSAGDPAAGSTSRVGCSATLRQLDSPCSRSVRRRPVRHCRDYQLRALRLSIGPALFTWVAEGAAILTASMIAVLQGRR